MADNDTPKEAHKDAPEAPKKAPKPEPSDDDRGTKVTWFGISMWIKG